MIGTAALLADTRALARAFLRWWRNELLGICREVLERAWPPAARQMRLEVKSDSIRLLHASKGHATVLWAHSTPGAMERLLAGTLAKPSLPLPLSAVLQVELPAAAMLEREIALPSAAERRLEEVLELQYARLMPLKRDLVLMDWHVADVDAEGPMRVRMAIMKRAAADAVKAFGSACGFEKCVITVPSTLGQGKTSYRFIPEHSATAPPGRGNKVLKALEIICVALAGGFALASAFGWIVHEQSIRAQLETMRQEADVAVGISRDLERRHEVLGQVRGAFSGVSLLDVIAAITKILPEGAWVQEFSRTHNRIRIVGSAPDASKLALDLEASPLFRNVELASAASNAQTGAETASFRFDLGMEIEERGAQ